MGRIYLMHFYTTLVEHCIRVVVGHKDTMGLSQKWINFTTEWVQNLSDSDRNFVYVVFQAIYNHVDIDVPLKMYSSEEETYDMNRERLFKLERDFAIKGGLIGSCSDEE